MEILKYLLLLLICFLGVISGYAVSLIAPEELRHGKKYFAVTSIILLVSILALFNYHQGFNFFSMLFTGIVILLIIYNKRYYPLLAIIIFLSLNNTQILTIQTSLIFLFGMFTTLEFMTGCEKNNMIEDKLGTMKAIVSRQALFIAVGAIFYILNDYNIIW